MKKLLGIAALILAFSPLAQAQNNSDALSGHPDARNDRQMESHDRRTVVHHDRKRVKHVRHAKPVHHVKHHHRTDDKK